MLRIVLAACFLSLVIMASSRLLLFSDEDIDGFAGFYMSFILIYKIPLSFPYTFGCWTTTFYGPLFWFV